MGVRASFKSNVRRAVLALQTTLVVAFFGSLVAILDVCFGNYQSAIADVVMVLVALLCYGLITMGYINTGKLLLVFTTLFVMTLNSSKEGPNSGNQYLWFTAIIGLFALFSLKEKKYLFGCLVATIGTLVFCHVTNFSFFLNPNLNPGWQQMNHTFIMYSTLLVSLFFIFSIARSVSFSFHDKDKDYEIIRVQKRALQ